MNDSDGPGPFRAADEGVYVIAELSANHGQDRERALNMVEAFAEAGADAVKAQTYTPDALTIDCNREPFRIDAGTAWDGRTLYDLYEEAYTPREWIPDLQTKARDHGVDFFSTAYDRSAVDFLLDLDVPCLKVASFELVDLPLIEYMASAEKPLIVSTGMGSREEIREAVETAREAGCPQLLLMHCTSAYPAPPDDMNLATIQHMEAAFRCPVGLSDHTTSQTVPALAVAAGARAVEKHVTLSRDRQTPDSHFSLEPEEFQTMVEHLRKAETVTGQPHYGAVPGERQSRVFRRSLFTVRDVEAGARLTRDSVRSIRPGNGLAPKHLPEVLGARAARDLPRGTPLQWELLEGADRGT